MALVDKKIELVNAARGNGGVATDPAHATETNVVRTVEEADRVLAILKAEKATIQTALDDAKTAYDNAVADVATNIGKMNKLQALVDAANLEYKEYFEDDTNADFVYDPEASTVTTLTAKDAIVTKVTKGTKTNEGEDDSPAEDKFELA